MFKVVIVDDEIYVVALIQKLINWEKFQMEVAGTANDGQSALKLVREINPDLVIVDVRMPGYDGIAFMDKVRECNTNIKFIVISGHKQFDYVRGAMRNSVEDYLLKPINKEELESVIGKVCKKLIEAQNKESRLKKMEEKLDFSSKKIREIFVNSILKEYKDFDLKLEQINERYLLHFQPGMYQMVALILEIQDSLGGIKEYDLILQEENEEFLQSLKKHCNDVLFTIYENNIAVFLFNYEEKSKEEIMNVVQNQLVQSNKRIKKFENLSFHLCVGKESRCLSDLSITVQNLWKCIFSRVSMHEEKIIEPEDIRKTSEVLPSILDFCDKRFSQSLSELNIDDISHCIKEMFSKSFYAIEEDSMLYYELYMELVERIYQQFNDIGICKESKLDFKQGLMKKFIQVSSHAEYARILSSEIAKMIEDNYLSDKDYAAPTIRIVKRYIANHYNEDISLTTAAQLVNISPIYLSRLFKKEVGINFLDYLNQFRINEAKNLLQNMKYNVIETAELSGFRNTKYFSKIFKKTVGITPSQYRKRHINENSV